MSRNSVKDTDLGWDRIKRTMGRLSGSHTKVGLQQGAQHKGEDGTSDLVSIGAAHEFGAPGIPRRSFLRPSYDENRKGLERVMAQEKGKIILGTSTIEDSLDRIGLLHTAQVQAKIRSNIPPPNAPATIAIKGSSATLIDTGQMIQSIRHVNEIKK
jgi:hypothetical protein